MHISKYPFTLWDEMKTYPTSIVCSREFGSNLVWYFFGSEISPLFLAHVTVGVGSPTTMALKIANLPASLQKYLNF